MNFLLKLLPWAICIFLLVLLLRCCQGVDSQLPPAYDSAVSAGAGAAARANDLASGLTVARRKTDSLISALNAKSSQLDQERLRRRSHPQVIQIIREIPAVDSAFQADDAALYAAQRGNFFLQQEFNGYRYQDSLYHLTRDTVESNLRYREGLAVEALQGMKPPSNFSLGVSAGLGAVYSQGQVYAGPGLQVGISYRIPLKRKAARR